MHKLSVNKAGSGAGNGGIEYAVKAIYRLIINWARKSRQLVQQIL
jgi:hypothetical protein